MATDRRGRKLHSGDKCSIPIRVISVQENKDGFNLLIQYIEPLSPGAPLTTLPINSNQVDLVESLGESALDIDISTALSGEVTIPKPDSGVLKGRGT